MKAPSKEFVDWCRRETPKSPPHYHFVFSHRLEQQGDLASFLDSIRQGLNNGSKLLVRFNDHRGNKKVSLKKDRKYWGQITVSPNIPAVRIPAV